MQNKWINIEEYVNELLIFWTTAVPVFACGGINVMKMTVGVKENNIMSLNSLSSAFFGVYKFRITKFSVLEISQKSL